MWLLYPPTAQIAQAAQMKQITLLMEGYDWSYQAKEEHPTNYALMELTSSESSSSLYFEVDSCSKTCLKAYATLKEQYDSLSLDYKKSQFILVSYKAGLQSIEERLVHYKKNEAVFEDKVEILNLEVRLRDNAIVEYKKKLKKAEKERDELKQSLEKFQNLSKSLNNMLESQVSDKVKAGLGYKAASPVEESFVKTSKILENQENVKSRSDKGYHVVPPPYTGNYIPPKPDLMFIDEQVESESVDVISNVSSGVVRTVESKFERVDVKNKGMYSTVETKPVKKNNFSPPIIEDWISDDKSEVEFVSKVEVKIVRPCIEKIKFVKTNREKVKKVETPKQHKHYPRGNQRNWNNLMSQRLGSNFKMINKACYVCGSFEHLLYDCDKRVVRPVWNNSRRVNHKNFANKMTHSHTKRRFVPQVNLTKSGKLKTAGTPVNTADSKPVVNYSRPKSNPFKRGYSQAIRPFNKYLAYKKTIFNKVVNVVKHYHAGFGKPNTGNLKQKEYKEKRVIDSGCSRHMTGNKCILLIMEIMMVKLFPLEMVNVEYLEKAKAVNTACYVLNKALDIKPHNKTPYELIHGRPPLIDFMKPFGCLVTILNTKNYLGKFDEKTDEGFQTNGIAGTKDNIVAGQAKKKKELEQEYILIPICTTDPLISQGPKDNEVDAGKKVIEVDASQVSDNGGHDDQITRSEFEGLLQQERQTKHINNTNSFNSVSLPVSAAGPSFVNAASPSPINAVGTPASTNAFEEHPFERFSPFKNAFSFPHVPIMTSINDTGIFGNAYDDESMEEEVDMNNVVFRDKKDERGIMIKNKARLVAQGHTQEEGIDYDELFAPVARIKAIRLFLAYASIKYFVVYQLDVKSTFLYRKIEEEVYVFKPPGFEDPDFPYKFYKVEKALYGLHQAPRAWYETLSTYLMDNGLQVHQKSDGIFISQDKYVADILKKFDFSTVNTESTLMEPNKALVKDAEAEDVDVHLYRSVIRSLMFLTASRPNITFFVCPCTSLWHPKDSPFDLEAYSYSDYAEASLDRKYTIGGCQILGKRLILWKRKKQTIVANSTIEVEYVIAASCCGQVL
nr:retrovirus-related Pol polyprotein from transposon TNT 1-94 [Tanacetum cinerariifolium]